MAKVSDEAKALHERSFVFDAHIDTLVENLVHPATPSIGDRTDKLHLDLPRAFEGGLNGGFFMVGGNRLPRTWLAIDRMHEEVDANADRFVLARTAAELRTAQAGGKFGGMMSFEGGVACQGELGVLRDFYRLGVRCIGVTHGEDAHEHGLQGEQSYFGYCTLEEREHTRKHGRGLTEFGRAAVAEMNRLGILIDTSHTNDRSFWDLVDLSDAPIVCTHGDCFALSPHSRNLTDEQLRTLGQKRGVLGLAFFGKFIDPKEPSLERLVDHAEHAIEIAGVDAVGIGSDFDGIGRSVPIVPEVSQLPTLTQAMLDRGFPAADVEKILGGNWLRVIEEVIG